MPIERDEMNLNKRQPQESLDQYHARLRARKWAEKIRAQGTLVWDSLRWGTYIKAKHGPLG